MITVLIVLGVWCVVAVTVSLLLGHLIGKRRP